MILTKDPERIRYLQEHAYEDKSQNFIAAFTTTLILAALAVLMRVLSRTLTKAQLKWDDYTIMVSLVLTSGNTVARVFQTYNGGGRHTIVVSPEQFVNYIQATWAASLTHLTVMFVTKASILLFYRRIFTLHDRWFAWGYYLAHGYNLCVFLSSFLSTLFQCQPMAFNWNKTLSGSCIDFHTFAIASSVLNLLADIFILTLPLGPVRKLHAARRQKLAIAGIFLLGGFVVVASSVRIPYLVLVDPVDLTWTNDGAALWSQVEANVAIVCACLPSFRPLWGYSRQRAGSYRSKYAYGSGSDRSWPKQSGPNGKAYADQHDRSAGPTRRSHGNHVPLDSFSEWKLRPQALNAQGVDNKITSAGMQDGEYDDVEDGKYGGIELQHDFSVSTDRA
ncbi:MAG: hypothetical protein M1833_001926 [Piccolia ochrophora]|nr:MAG: hypothetical protein M1833_001926 [Piccolia ochrophora]